MNCPVCDASLRSVVKHGVEVDICPDCKGVWLDRGELDKLVQLAATDGPVQQAAPERPAERERVYEEDRRPREEEPRRRDDHYDRDHDRGYGHGPHKKRRGSWLSEVFESFGGGDD